MEIKTRNKLDRIKKRFDALALEQLRELAADLQQQLELAEMKIIRTQDHADFWRDGFFEMQQTFIDDDHENHSIGLTKSGELLVVKTDTQQEITQCKC